MRSLEEVASVEGLVRAGLNDCAIARLTGLPRTTVRDWRLAQRWVPRKPRPSLISCETCGHPRHRFDQLADRYAYLLGLYLGDGYLVHHRRGVYRMPAGRVGLQFRFGGTCAWVTNSSKQWPCLFPQHGPGKKHERKIELTDWQLDVVRRHPKELLRGLIHSDGCRFTNTVRHGAKTYEYPRYNFTNRSDDIKGIFCNACDLLGVEWRVMNRWNISVARRASVARLDEFIGPKA